MRALAWARPALLFLPLVLAPGVPAQGAGLPSRLVPECVRAYADRQLEFLDKKVADFSVWEFSPEAEARFREIVEDPALTSVEQTQALFDAMVEARLDEAHPVTRYLMRRVLQDAQAQQGLYSKTVGRFMFGKFRTHYNALTNRVTYLPRGNSHIRDLVVLFHELEHAQHRNTSPLPWIAMMKFSSIELSFLISPPLSPLIRRHLETRAMGAQWELARRIPAARREELLRQLRREIEILSKPNSFDRQARAKSTRIREYRMGIDGTLGREVLDLFDDPTLTDAERASALGQLQADRAYLLELAQDERFWKVGLRDREAELKLLHITEASLRHAELDKESFVAELSKVHEYALVDVIRNQVSPLNSWKLYMLTISMPAVIDIVTSGHTSRTIFQHDLSFVMRLYAQLLFGGRPDPDEDDSEAEPKPGTAR